MVKKIVILLLVFLMIDSNCAVARAGILDRIKTHRSEMPNISSSQSVTQGQIKQNLKAIQANQQTMTGLQKTARQKQSVIKQKMNRSIKQGSITSGQLQKLKNGLLALERDHQALTEWYQQNQQQKRALSAYRSGKDSVGVNQGLEQILTHQQQGIQLYNQLLLDMDSIYTALP